MNLFVDATDLLGAVGNMPTGIPRVHGFLVGQALADPDPAVRTIVFDRALGRYRTPTDAEAILLNQTRYPLHASDAANSGFRAAVRRIRKNPNLTREFDRNMASRIAASDHGSGLRYSLVKTSIRAYRLGQWIGRASIRRPDPDEVDIRNGVILFADLLDTIKPISTGMRLGPNSAFVCHDLIPWTCPNFVSQREARRFASQLATLLKTGAKPICTSEASRLALESFIEKSRCPQTEIARFSLPSTLYESAKAIDRTSRFEPDEPFVLYCSTIDKRKNHLLLAKIWKQALDDGVSLPKLVCVGKWGGAGDELRAYLRAHPQLAARIKFPGPIDDIELIDLYRSASFGVMPSYMEGWGLGASEGLDFGLPVVVSTSPALQEATQYLMPAIDPDDQVGWYTKLRELSESGAAREALRKRICDRYTPIWSQTTWHSIKASVGLPLAMQ